MDRFNDLFIDEDVNNYASNYVKSGDFYAFFSRLVRVFATFYAEYVVYAATFIAPPILIYTIICSGDFYVFSPLKNA